MRKPNYLFADDMIQNIGERKDLKRLLVFIGEFGKVTGYKIHEQKPIVLIYTNSSVAKKELVRSPPSNIEGGTLKSLK